jgi:hypothetical protein
MIQSAASGNTDMDGELNFSGTSTASYSFTGTGNYSEHPECVVTPQFNPTTNTYWVTYTSTTSFTINFSGNVTGNVSYICMGRE